MRKISLRVPVELYDELIQLADDNDRAFSDIVRLALVDFITEHGGKSSPGFEVTCAGIFQILGLTQALVEQMDDDSISRAHAIAKSLASKHGVTDDQLAALRYGQLGVAS